MFVGGTRDVWFFTTVTRPAWYFVLLPWKLLYYSIVQYEGGGGGGGARPWVRVSLAMKCFLVAWHHHLDLPVVAALRHFHSSYPRSSRFRSTTSGRERGKEGLRKAELTQRAIKKMQGNFLYRSHCTTSIPDPSPFLSPSPSPWCCDSSGQSVWKCQPEERPDDQKIGQEKTTHIMLLFTPLYVLVAADVLKKTYVFFRAHFPFLVFTTGA